MKDVFILIKRKELWNLYIIYLQIYLLIPIGNKQLLIHQDVLL